MSGYVPGSTSSCHCGGRDGRGRIGGRLLLQHRGLPRPRRRLMRLRATVPSSWTEPQGRLGSTTVLALGRTSLLSNRLRQRRRRKRSLALLVALIAARRSCSAPQGRHPRLKLASVRPINRRRFSSGQRNTFPLVRVGLRPGFASDRGGYRCCRKRRIAPCRSIGCGIPSRENPSSIFIKNKRLAFRHPRREVHLRRHRRGSGLGGPRAVIGRSSVSTEPVRRHLPSDRAAGRVVGTRGQTNIRVIITNDGGVINVR